MRIDSFLYPQMYPSLLARHLCTVFSLRSNSHQRNGVYGVLQICMLSLKNYTDVIDWIIFAFLFHFAVEFKSLTLFSVRTFRLALNFPESASSHQG